MSGTISVSPSPAKVGDKLVVSPDANSGFGTKASLTTALTGANNDLKFTAKKGGIGGNAITITYSDPGGTTASESVSVSGNAITVHLARASSAISSTGNTILASIAGSTGASALVTAALAAGNDGTGLVIALSSTPLASGADDTVELEFISESNAIDDVRVNVKFGDSTGAGSNADSSAVLTYTIEAEGGILVNARVAGAIVDSATVEVFTES